MFPPSLRPRGRPAPPDGQRQGPRGGRDGQQGPGRGRAAENLALGHGSARHAQAGSDEGGQIKADARGVPPGVGQLGQELAAGALRQSLQRQGRAQQVPVSLQPVSLRLTPLGVSG
jgi:hypothetical protein